MDSRKRTACLICTRAKAKCSQSVDGSDSCQRCRRLNKQCAYAETTKKSGAGPKPRSRVRQLERRVEDLMELIVSNNATTTTAANQIPTINPEKETPVQLTTPDSNEPTDPSPQDQVLERLVLPAFETYDPIDAGLIEEDYAYLLLEEFKSSFILTFPFVLVDVDGPTLRREEPFLFHAILTVTAYENKRLLLQLENTLRHEIARMIEHCRKSLGILQGLLVYTAWYHCFYHPVNQQLAIMIQLCVALVQDLGYSKNVKGKPRPMSIAQCGKFDEPDPIASKRAFLGTFFLTVTFAQAWRKRTSLPYTRFMGKCCEIFEGSSVPTDALISPMVKASELISRINDHFSYDDIESADVHGDLMLEMSTTNFHEELKRLKESSSKTPFVRDNTSVQLIFCELDIWIYESCIHTSLWKSASQPDPKSLSVTRLKMLDRSMNAALAYLNVLVSLPQQKLRQLAFQTWSGWFYAVIIICKLVFLEENDRNGTTQFFPIPQELDEMIPEHSDERNQAPASRGPSTQTSWTPLNVAREYDIQGVFDRFMDYMSFALPAADPPWVIPPNKQVHLYAIACIQRTMLQGFTKRIQRMSASANSEVPDPTQPDCVADANTTTSYTAGYNTSAPPNPPHAFFNLSNAGQTHPTVQSSLPFLNAMNFDTLDFEGITIPSSYGMQASGFDDWMWDTIMDDFSMPTL